VLKEIANRKIAGEREKSMRVMDARNAYRSSQEYREGEKKRYSRMWRWKWDGYISKKIEGKRAADDDVGNV